MSSILVRDLDARVVNRLKAIARRHGRSLQREVKVILAEAASFFSAGAVEAAEKWRKNLAGRKFSDSSVLLREDRDR